MSEDKKIVTNPLSGNFSHSGADQSLRGFSHPQEKDVIKQAAQILEKTDTGARLIEVMNYYKIPVRVMSGREITYPLSCILIASFLARE